MFLFLYFSQTEQNNERSFGSTFSICFLSNQTEKSGGVRAPVVILESAARMTPPRQVTPTVVVPMEGGTFRSILFLLLSTFSLLVLTTIPSLFRILNRLTHPTSHCLGFFTSWMGHILFMLSIFLLFLLTKSVLFLLFLLIRIVLRKRPISFLFFLFDFPF